MEGKGSGCLGIVVIIVVIGFLVQGCNALFGVHDDDASIVAAQEGVKEYLKYPDDADFCDNDKITHLTDVDQYLVTGCVDAKNAFGMSSEHYYRVTVDKDDNVVSVDLDGQ
jgi:hypothetical protein